MKSKPQVIAFIPARGGSKSIPLKNISILAGKPLIYWSLESLETNPEVAAIVVATDSEEIKKVVTSFSFKKVSVYNRSLQNSQDTSSTESVVLEYLEHCPYDKNSRFLLVQATSPLTSSEDVSNIIKVMDEGYDSALSCVTSKRFFWSVEGTPLNYNPAQRPRRQDFDGNFMENGALYISTIKRILESGVRVSGRIGISHMPDYTAYEVDEPSDWIIIEKLVEKYRAPKRSLKSQIKLFMSDVDGVLTDSGMYYSENGDELKRFSTYDGIGFANLKSHGILCGILTAEDRKLNLARAKKLNLDYCLQNAKDKLGVIKELCESLNIQLNEVAYVGDEYNDLELLGSVGLPACPANASKNVKAIPGILCLDSIGGSGVVREFSEMIIAHNSQFKSLFDRDGQK